MRIRNALVRLIGEKETSCPNEAEVLSFSENRLSSRNRAQIERHFVNCPDCQEVLAFLGRASYETMPPSSAEEISVQTARVLGYIRNDEANPSRQTDKARSPVGFRLSYPKLATLGVVVSAIAIASIYLLTSGQSPTDAGMEALMLAFKNGRHNETRVSGGFAYSRYSGTTRGGEDGPDDLPFDRAESKVRSAAQDISDVPAQLVLARSYLARGTAKAANQALGILDQLSKRGVETPETLNDTGVAQVRLGKYDDAIDLFTRALTLSPRYDEALFNRAIANEHLQRYPEARKDWQQFIDQSVDENWKNEAKSRLNRLNTSIDR